LSGRYLILEDLIINENCDSVLDAIGLPDSKNFKHLEECELCGSKAIERVEILGAYDKPLFWECQDCDKLYLVKRRTATELLLAKAVGTWTSPLDWGKRDRSEFN
jgi:hypothetical protein